jgi:hypothetical protein
MVYFLSTLILVIIMLNLLISIIGDSFEKIMALDRNNLNFERASILLEIDISLGDERFDYL